MNKQNPDVVAPIPNTPAWRRQRQEDSEFEASLECIVDSGSFLSESFKMR